MFQIRRSDERGRFDHGWLRTSHTFSFGEYRDPAHVHFRTLRVMNEDHVAPGQGFDLHGHRDMEIVTYVIAGTLQHRDDLGNVAQIQAGEWQRMTAGRGIMHSESNPSPTEWVHLYQIWIFPDRRGLDPGYRQRTFPMADRRDRWQTVVAPGTDGDWLDIHQDAHIRHAELAAGSKLVVPLAMGHSGWLQIVRGSVRLGEAALAAGDGVAVREETSFEVEANEPSELLWFDLA